MGYKYWERGVLFRSLGCFSSETHSASCELKENYETEMFWGLVSDYYVGGLKCGHTVEINDTLVHWPLPATSFTSPFPIPTPVPVPAHHLSLENSQRGSSGRSYSGMGSSWPAELRRVVMRTNGVLEFIEELESFDTCRRRQIGWSPEPRYTGQIRNGRDRHVCVFVLLLLWGPGV